ncbi:MAG: HAMP domain-containing protein [Planctomycetales bacterium]|nr:HAMP domain-containing protein [Planctomycetales bacterium]
MLSHWPIRTKLQVGLGLLLAAVLALFGSAQYGLYAYRGLLRSIAARSAELPLASDVRQHVSDLRVTLSQAIERLDMPDYMNHSGLVGANYEDQFDSDYDYRDDVSDRNTPSYNAIDMQMARQQYRDGLTVLVDSVDRYRRQWEENRQEAGLALGDDSAEGVTLADIDRVLARLQADAASQASGHDWMLDRIELGRIRAEVERMGVLVAELPSHLHNRFRELAVDMRARYRMAIFVSWVTAAVSLVVLLGAGRVFYKWFANPLETLVQGSREVAGGNFNHRIQLATGDEMGELADAMNAMTERFREIKDDLNEQVRVQAGQVVRSEQLASVGFLAAGVSHEINNPLASIALCSESLEGRLQELLASVDQSHADDVQVARNYLQMIQREAFRCKQITEKLLDFARRGDSQRSNVELRELTAGVIEMVQHLGRYQDRQFTLADGPPVIAAVNPQEIKQVVLNLVTNALESLEAGGQATVTISQRHGQAAITVEDNGCGMTEEVRRHLFEPFFTRRRTGQGTGLGLSITHRIVEEHGGRIEADSDGPGRGSRFTVTLPAAATHEETNHRYHAA